MRSERRIIIAILVSIMGVAISLLLLFDQMRSTQMEADAAAQQTTDVAQMIAQIQRRSATNAPTIRLVASDDMPRLVRQAFGDSGIDASTYFTDLQVLAPRRATDSTMEHACRIRLRNVPMAPLMHALGRLESESMPTGALKIEASEKEQDRWTVEVSLKCVQFAPEERAGRLQGASPE